MNKAKLIAYGENGVTNKLLETFMRDKRNLENFLRYVYWYDGSQGGKESLAKRIKVIVEQMGFGRRQAKGEPDGLIITGKGLIFLETKMGRISSISNSKAKILGNYIDICREMYCHDRFPQSHRNNDFIVENIINNVPKNKDLWYLIILTDGKWEDTKIQFEKIAKILCRDKTITNKHIGWISMDVVREIAKANEDLQNALNVNKKN